MFYSQVTQALHAGQLDLCCCCCWLLLLLLVALLLLLLLLVVVVVDNLLHRGIQPLQPLIRQLLFHKSADMLELLVACCSTAALSCWNRSFVTFCSTLALSWSNCQ